MSILDRLVSVYAPFRCLGCDAENDRLLCESCVQSVSQTPPCCYRCRARTHQYEVCRRCRPKTPLRRVATWARYDDVPKALLWRAKYERAHQGLAEIAELMESRLPYFGSDVILVPVPTASSRVRQRGYDQAVVLAKCLGRSSGLPVMRLLARLGQAHQVGASRAERLRHLDHAFRPLRITGIKGAHIVLVDDVCTTGATLEAAARTLRQAGAKRVDALVFAQPN